MFLHISLIYDNKWELTDTLFKADFKTHRYIAMASEVFQIYKQRRQPISSNMVRYYQWNYTHSALSMFNKERSLIEVADPIYKKYSPCVERLLKNTMFKSITYIQPGRWDLIDTNFIQTIPSGRYYYMASGVFQVYKKRGPVASNIARYYQWNYNKSALSVFNDECPYVSSYDPDYKKYVPCILNYLSKC